jgi:hypothetical protein
VNLNCVTNRVAPRSRYKLSYDAEQYKTIHTLLDIPYLQPPHPTVRQKYCQVVMAIAAQGVAWQCVALCLAAGTPPPCRCGSGRPPWERPYLPPGEPRDPSHVRAQSGMARALRATSAQTHPLPTSSLESTLFPGPLGSSSEPCRAIINLDSNSSTTVLTWRALAGLDLPPMQAGRTLSSPDSLAHRII